MVGPGTGDGNTANAGSKGGRAEGLMDMAAWINGDRLEVIKMGGGEDGAVDLPSPGDDFGTVGNEEAGRRRRQWSAGDVGDERPWQEEQSRRRSRKEKQMGIMARGKSA